MTRLLVGSMMVTLTFLGSPRARAAPRAWLASDIGAAPGDHSQPGDSDATLMTTPGSSPNLSWLVRAANRVENATIGPTASSSSARPLPARSLALPAHGRISSEFGPRRHPILHRARFHRGVDIAASAGSPIMAARDGTVTRVGPHRGYGLMIEIDHGGGLRTRYAHAASVTVRRGQSVAQRQIIARVGKTGLATAPHLHYEVWSGPVPVDPLAPRPR